MEKTDRLNDLFEYFDVFLISKISFSLLIEQISIVNVLQEDIQLILSSLGSK